MICFSCPLRKAKVFAARRDGSQNRLAQVLIAIVFRQIELVEASVRAR